ncbi:MAG: DivIVA domain-containing protein [Actinomycetota bacterium]|nr:DivIVA domain-containing protein [Actinomycetota bacterium]
MPLTPAEVRATQFATTRVRSGYDVDEVDAFLDIVESDIGRLSADLLKSRDEAAVLRTQYDQLQLRLRAAELELAAAKAKISTANPQDIRHDTVEIARPDIGQFTGDGAAALAIAQATADEIIGSARRQARGIRTEMRSQLEAQLAELNKSDATDT